MAVMDQQRLAALQNYTATRRYVLDNKRFKKHAEMVVRMTYTAPGRKHFEVLSESGSSWIRNHVLRKMLEAELESSDDAQRNQTRITPQNYEFRSVGFESQQGRTFHVLEVKPRTPNKYLFQGRVWLDTEDAAVARIEGSPAQPPSFWTREIRFVHRYDKHGQFWLPTSNHSETQVRVFGTTTVHIDYFDYQINRPANQLLKPDDRRRVVRNADNEAPTP